MTASRPVKPIETSWAGCRFRSRLEARWAVFLTKMGWRWEFEPEGFETPAGRYLPDFRLHHPAGIRWIEVKPHKGDEPRPEARWISVATGTGIPLLAVFGMHRTGDGCSDTRRPPADRPHAALLVQPDGSVWNLGAVWTDDAHRAAWDAASSARFEHGEAPGR